MNIILPLSLVENVLRRYRAFLTIKPDRTNPKIVNALRLAKDDLSGLERIVAEQLKRGIGDNLFSENQLCDGAMCPKARKESCARYMVGVDLSRCSLGIPVSNKRRFPVKCPYWLAIPDPRYPRKDTVQ